MLKILRSPQDDRVRGAHSAKRRKTKISQSTEDLNQSRGRKPRSVNRQKTKISQEGKTKISKSTDDQNESREARPKSVLRWRDCAEVNEAAEHGDVLRHSISSI